jgi:tetratricopeptide (TPR) repeat protein
MSETLTWDFNMEMQDGRLAGVVVPGELVDPQQLVPIFCLAEFLRQKKRYDAAIECYDELLRLEPNFRDPLKLKAAVLMMLGRVKEALICFGQVLQENPFDGHGMLGMAMVLTDLDRHSEALVLINKAADLCPNSSLLYKVKAVILAQIHNYEQAMVSLEKAITECDPCDITSMTSCLIRKGIVLGCLEQYKESIETCLKARDLGVTDAEEQMMMEICRFASKTKLIQRPDYLGFGGYIKVPTQLYDRLMGRYWRRDPEILTFAGVRCMMGGAESLPIEHEAALSMFNLSIELNPDYAEAYSLKGVVLDWQGKHKEAKVNHTQAIKLQPKNAVLSERLANNYYMCGDSKKALSIYEKATRIDPKSPTAWSNMGVVLLEMGKNAKALQCFDKALALFPSFTSALGGKADTMSLLGRHSEALQCIDKVLGREHDDIRLWRVKILILARAGQRSEALKMCDDALRENPKSVTLWQTKADALLLLKDHVQASACAKMAEELSRRYTK